MDLVFILAVVGFIVMLTCMCCRSKRARPMFSAPVLVTTTEYVQAGPGAGTVVNTVPVMSSAQAMGHTGPVMVQHTHYQAAHQAAPYPMQMPMAYQQSAPAAAAAGGIAAYPMPQPQAAGYPPQQPQQQPIGAYPMPRHDNPPTYDQVAVSDAYQKQQPYNPNFQP